MKKKIIIAICTAIPVAAFAAALCRRHKKRYAAR